MLDSGYCIVDQPLPEALDAVALKKQGIEQLQSLAGDVWTNYNDSDPGVTILDQLCYALTELGYCAQFPIEDVLTGADGTIRYQDQFFEPQNILTCSPVTPDDYRRLVLDAIPEVRVIDIEAETLAAPGGAGATTPPCHTGRYVSYFSVKDADPRVDPAHIIDRVHVLLNQHRNLGEWFLPPVPLKPKAIPLTGRIILAPSADVAKVRARLSHALRDYAAPLAVQSGYAELRAGGVEPDAIFNGPKLRHGWIAGPGALKEKCACVSLCGLTSCIADVEGVQSVEALGFVGPADQTEITIEPTEIADITFSDGFEWEGGAPHAAVSRSQAQHLYLENLSAKHQAASVASNVDLHPDLPRGRYRDIEDYYSVQNTFPDIYGIGYNSLGPGAASYRVASSRQLKGYLMPFDQLLANQFSQLAHIGDLFSFRARPIQTAPSAIPSKKFVTTYFCQPLYDIPDVKPLLLGNDAFRVEGDPDKTEKQVEEVAWKKFREFQFNEYLHGLRRATESDAEASARRDGILSHLMARHGDDAAQYDEMIETCQWFGGALKTRIVVKTIWLQNFELLSYHRTRAINLYWIDQLPQPGQLPIRNTGTMAQGGPSAKPGTPGESIGPAPRRWFGQGYPTIDGEVDQRRIYADALLKKSDLENFSAFELKLGILLGLSTRMRRLAELLSALLDDSRFAQWLKKPLGERQRYPLPDSDISVKGGSGPGSPDQLFEGGECLMDIVWSDASAPPGQADYQAHADQLLWLATQTRGFLLIESILLLSGQGCDQVTTRESPYFLNACLLFPGYVTLVQQPRFRAFIDTLSALHWPTHVAQRVQFASFDFLRTLLPVYVARNNGFNNRKALRDASARLAQLLDFPPTSANGAATS